MNPAEPLDVERTVTRRRRLIVAHGQPATRRIEASFGAPGENPAGHLQASAPRADDVRALATSEQLLAGRSTMDIRHNGATYTLRVTRFGRLVLTK